MAVHVVHGLLHLLEHDNGRSTTPAGGGTGVNHGIMHTIPQHVINNRASNRYPFEAHPLQMPDRLVSPAGQT